MRKDKCIRLITPFSELGYEVYALYVLWYGIVHATYFPLSRSPRVSSGRCSRFQADQAECLEEEWGRSRRLRGQDNEDGMCGYGLI